MKKYPKIYLIIILAILSVAMMALLFTFFSNIVKLSSEQIEIEQRNIKTIINIIKDTKTETILTINRVSSYNDNVEYRCITENNIYTVVVDSNQGVIKALQSHK